MDKNMNAGKGTETQVKYLKISCELRPIVYLTRATTTKESMITGHKRTIFKMHVHS